MAAGPAPPWKATRPRSPRPRSRPTGAASSPRLTTNGQGLARGGRWPLDRHPPGRPLGPVNSAAFSPDGRSIVTASYDNTARVWQVEWLLSDESRAWVSAHSEGPRLGLLVKSSCAEKLNGTERRIVDSEGREVGKESARRLTHEDVLAAPILSGLEGEDGATGNCRCSTGRWCGCSPASGPS